MTKHDTAQVDNTPPKGSPEPEQSRQEKIHQNSSKSDHSSSESAPTPPLRVRRSLRRNKSTAFLAGRTIGEKRERLETKRERAVAREKDKRKYRLRIISVSLSFLILIVILIVLARIFITQPVEEPPISVEPEPVISAEPTIEIVIEGSTNNQITSRMRSFIGLVESDLRSYNYHPIKAVIPSGAIREVDFYLDGYPGFIKTTIDRGAGVTAEDADRMLRYLQGQGIDTFEYIDLRLDGRAFWR